MNFLTITALTLMTLSLNVFAQDPEGTIINVPMPTHHQGYYGTIGSVEKELKEELTNKAIAVCKTRKNIAAIADVEVTVAFSLIEIDETKFEGGYPLASATAEVFCHNNL